MVCLHSARRIIIRLVALAQYTMEAEQQIENPVNGDEVVEEEEEVRNVASSFLHANLL